MELSGPGLDFMGNFFIIDSVSPFSSFFFLSDFLFLIELVLDFVVK